MQPTPRSDLSKELPDLGLCSIVLKLSQSSPSGAVSRASSGLTTCKYVPQQLQNLAGSNRQGTRALKSQC